jgi:hypothetical protein
VHDETARHADRPAVTVEDEHCPRPSADFCEAPVPATGASPSSGPEIGARSFRSS